MSEAMDMTNIGISVYIVVSITAVIVGILNKDIFTGLTVEKNNVATEQPHPPLPASFSRTVGLIGLIFLTGFMWVIGLHIISGSALLETINKSDILSDFLIVASALFAPYAANQVGQILSRSPTTTSTGVSSTNGTSILTPLPPPD